MGIYSVTEGFSGTIERYVNGVKDLVGSVTGKIPDQGNLALNYLGTFSGIWSGAAATAQGDPHTPSASDPLAFKFSLILQAMDLAAASTAYDLETPEEYSNPSESIQCVVTSNDPENGFNTVAMTVLSPFTDPVRGIVLNAV